MYSDVVIVGAGPVGGLLALALAKKGFSVTILDRRDITYTPEDHRQFAFSLDILRWMEELGLRLNPSFVTQICLSFHKKRDPIVFNAQDSGAPVIGGVVPHGSVVSAIRSCLQSHPTIITHSLASIHQWTWKEAFWELGLSTGKTVITSLVIGCDGANSDVRQFFSPGTYTFPFPQRICLFTFSPLPLHVAYEHFFPGGSLALLPLHEGKGTGIWMGSEKQFHSLDIKSCVETYLQERGYPQSITLINRYDQFTPFLQVIQKCVFPRCVVVGDSAQVVHPIAGQGVNLGLRMARLLAQHLADRKSLGLDWGTGLDPYQRQWRKASLAMQGVTSAIVTGYSLVARPFLWDITLKGIQTFPSIRKKLARHATWG